MHGATHIKKKKKFLTPVGIATPGLFSQLHCQAVELSRSGTELDGFNMQINTEYVL
jgi:hypothetical protein